MSGPEDPFLDALPPELASQPVWAEHARNLQRAGVLLDSLLASASYRELALGVEAVAPKELRRMVAILVMQYKAAEFGPGSAFSEWLSAGDADEQAPS